MLVATNINDLVEATVTAKLVRERALDRSDPEKPYRVVAQHIVGLAAVAPVTADEVFDLVRRAWRPSRDLIREEIRPPSIPGRRRRRFNNNTLQACSGKFNIDDGLISWRIRGLRASSW